MMAVERKKEWNVEVGFNEKTPRVDYLMMHKTREMADMRRLFPRSSGVGAVNSNNY